LNVSVHWYILLLQFWPPQDWKTLLSVQERHNNFVVADKQSAAANNLKNNKAPGPDGISAEIFKFGVNLLLQRLHSFISNAWPSNILPTQWKDANITTIYKEKAVAFPYSLSQINYLPVECWSVFWHTTLTQWFRNLSVAFVARGATLIWFSLQDCSRRNVGNNIVTFLLPSSTLQRFSTPPTVICCGESWTNLDVLNIFLASNGNSMLGWVPASCREEKCRRVLVWTQS